jgi:hypothetical protein
MTQKKPSLLKQQIGGVAKDLLPYPCINCPIIFGEKVGNDLK